MDINWYHVFDSAKGLWLGADEKSWSKDYSDAAEFGRYELAEQIARRVMGPNFNGLVIILADCGAVEMETSQDKARRESERDIKHAAERADLFTSILNKHFVRK